MDLDLFRRYLESLSSVISSVWSWRIWRFLYSPYSRDEVSLLDSIWVSISIYCGTVLLLKSLRTY
jgi:hypothetical protein